jgi:hypothetical protein
VTTRAVTTGTAIVTHSGRVCMRICIPSKPATAYRRAYGKAGTVAMLIC